jgi:uncharacterized integral membrane protein (TIGR00698 family)
MTSEHDVPRGDPSAFAAHGGIWRGVALAGAIATAAMLLRQVSALGLASPMVISIVLGMLLQNTVGAPAAAGEGLRFCVRHVLRFAVILLGFQLTAAEIIAIGPLALLVVAASLLTTFVFTLSIARLMGVDAKLAELIAAGTSVCGASAIVAANAVTRARDEDVAYAIACVTVLGTASVLIYPLLSPLLDLTPAEYGLWAGASIHEVGQVVAAAFQGDTPAGEIGTLAKLSRVMMLAPLLLALGWMSRRKARSTGKEAAGATAPWFIAGFIAVVAVNSVIHVPAEAKAWIAVATTFLLSVALAAMGLETSMGKLKAKGLRPLGLAVLSWAFIAIASLLLLKLLT